ncbi:MAG: acetyl-CoA carboxylase biotin carboxylase subunit [Rhodospirillales bacterium RIFCSPLOWO2_12_FULL_58_28]|nr:MAG: acetyl-CoA carboxylase biotin carboxylase subunit [Rhodospirillales bacterium RIFCSPLOWO2_02_FULL_58_16]OHC80023.1 MAG: acetyl-CoA carboxylase biotin carboxylase subunit [Rhodospirillales bacterium RIFCSPLOWO2_12_FULL_58_28]
MFKKILIANRGEIACRVMRTARKMGIKTVAVYSEADKDALHVGEADEAVCIGPPPSSGSYLSIKNIIRAIRHTGAEAVHPGYGFLSENAAFARKLAKEGIVFIGPPPAAIDAMGDKIRSKKLAKKAGVSTVPGYAESLKDVDQALSVSRDIGYPIMIKASAGGGGKGIRIAHDDDQVRTGFHSAMREAESSFGDGRVFIEKFIENPRHIEIQVLADSHGNVIHLGERECSIQRRHQKVIEEAPSPFLDAKTRKAMGDQAIMLARAVKYASAGTVEFIVDAERNFYFLEMNTRLQVEHPVTELTTGLDLVELMIRIAAGEHLPLRQEDVKRSGWAIEARIYAEDPARGFMPSAGRLRRYQPPVGDGVRVDTGVYEGGDISVHYDPMIAKLITHGHDRNEAIARMGLALDGFLIRGVSHNIAFLAAILAHPRFVQGNLSTAFIAEEFPNGFDPASAPHDDPAMLVAVAAASIHHAYQQRAASISGQVSGHERRVHGDWVVILKGENHQATVSSVDGGFDISMDEGAHKVRTDWKVGEPLFHAVIDGSELCMQVERNVIKYRMTHAGLQDDVLVLNPDAAKFQAIMPTKAPPDASRLLRSPMPGLLISLAVRPGRQVKAGEELAVIEAMKMENIVCAERDGVIKAVHAEPGDRLTADQVIIEFEP